MVWVRRGSCWMLILSALVWPQPSKIVLEKSFFVVVFFFVLSKRDFTQTFETKWRTKNKTKRWFRSHERCGKLVRVKTNIALFVRLIDVFRERKIARHCKWSISADGHFCQLHRTPKLHAFTVSLCNSRPRYNWILYFVIFHHLLTFQFIYIIAMQSPLHNSAHFLLLLLPLMATMVMMNDLLCCLCLFAIYWTGYLKPVAICQFASK